MNLPRFFQKDTWPADLDVRLLGRDAALWIGRVSTDPSGARGQAAARLVHLPWNLILVEDTSAAIANLLTDDGTSRPTRVAGHRIPVASPVLGISFPDRSVPLLFLNGRDDGGSSAERPAATGRQSALLRRLGMMDELLQRSVPVLLLLPGEADDLDALLADAVAELRPHIVAVQPTSSQVDQLRYWAATRPGPSSVTVCTGAVANLVDELAQRVSARLPSNRLLLRVQCYLDKQPEVVDCTESVPLDSPVHDSFLVLQEQHLGQLSEDALEAADLDGFFSRTAEETLAEYWRPFAAGLPWPRDTGAAEMALLEELASVRNSATGLVSLMTVDSEPGAGGTTSARVLAFRAAQAGCPTLIARSGTPAPKPEVATAFLHAVDKVVRGESSQSPNTLPAEAPSALPAVVVFDVEHLLGRDDLLPSYMRAFQRFGRRAVLLVVRDTTSRPDVALRSRRLFKEPLSHTLSEQEVKAFGGHLNRFLSHVGRDQPLAQWKAFWEDNTLQPEPGGAGGFDRSSSFWVALEFWLRRQLNLGESVRTWLYRQFTRAAYRGEPLTPATKRTVLTVAALSVERTHIPEHLLGAAPAEQDPLSVQLSELASQTPSLGLVRRRTESSHAWGVTHLPLAQHLLDAAAEDLDLMKELGIQAHSGSVRLRIELLAGFARTPALGQDRHRQLALRFPQFIFKLDRAGHQEFARQWRDVFNALFGMPDVLWDSSRAFNHHVAISRRRVAVDDDLFPDKTDDDRLRLLDDALSDLEYALSLERTDGEERDLNILNSLARACQDLAHLLKRIGGDPERIRALEAREIECLRSAEQSDPNNSHVLETTARSFILAADRDPESAPQHLCAALLRISTARRLGTAADRRQRLDELIEQAYAGLSQIPGDRLEQLRTSNPNVAAMITAWRLLRLKHAEGLASIAASAGPQVAEAISTLEALPVTQRDWPATRLLYDLVAIQEPANFERQYAVLQALDGTPAMQLQLRVERAILLHQIGAHPRAEQEFRDVRYGLADSEAIIDVPRRLAWFLQPGTSVRAICDGRVVPPPGNWRRSAMRVAQLGNLIVGFDPLDFGAQSVPVGRVLKCVVGFNVRGPYAAPAPQA